MRFPGEKSPCRVNRSAAADRARALRAALAPGAIPPPPVIPSAPRVFVIRVEFSDVPMATDLAAAQGFFTSVRNYYIENSYGVFVPTFTVSNRVAGGTAGTFGSYRLGAQSLYGADCGADVACNDPLLFMQAVAAATVDADFTQYDHIMIYHAGQGQETPGSTPNDLWSVYCDQGVFGTGACILDVNATADGKSFPGFTVVPEREGGGYSALGVICHEYGHQLGLVDLYDVSVPGGVSTVGAWDVMDYPYTGGGAQPPHLGAWSKHYLGFTQPFTSSGTVVMPPVEAAASRATGTNRIAIPGTNEYFLMEYRWRDDPTTSFDKAQPAAAGLAVWHVDGDIVTNAGLLSGNIVNAPSLSLRGHRGVDLVEADGVQSSGSDVGSNDLFTDGRFASGSQTNAFNGQAGGMTVAVTGGTGTNALTTQVVFFRAAANASIAKLINYPNPGGDASRYPVRPGAPAGTVTTLVVRLTRPVNPAKMSVEIYDMGGDRVRSVPGEALVFKIGPGEPTADEKWVYEYDWNGRNDAGENVAGGVYLYRVKADKEVKTGKLAILR